MSVFPKDQVIEEPQDNQNKPPFKEEEEDIVLKKLAYHKLVEDWAYSQHNGSVSFFIPSDVRNPEFSLKKIKAGFSENITAYIKTYKLDEDLNGSLQPMEIKEKEEEAKALVDGYLNLLINFGVIGALFFSVLFSSVFSDLPIADESLAYFGEYTIKAFKYVFYIGINTSIIFSIHMISRSVALYKHLGFWMPDLQAQLDWIQKISITSTIWISFVILYFAAFAIPFGAAVAISPTVGMISAIGIVVMVLLARDIMRVEEMSELILQQHVRRILRKKQTN